MRGQRLCGGPSPRLPVERPRHPRCNLEQFPYALFFKVENEVIVVACLHSRRHPMLSKERSLGITPNKPPEP